MRRKDREITDHARIIQVMKRCEVCHVAFFDTPYPYVVPMTFGLLEYGERVTLYFHGAKSGHKHDLLRRNPHVAFCMELTHGLVTGPEVGACEFTMEFDSVCGTGIMEYALEGEKIPALRAMLEHYHIKEGEQYHFHEELVPGMEILKLAVHDMTGKRREVKRG